MALLKKLLSPGEESKSRIHDLDGVRVQSKFILLHLPRSLFSYLLKIFGVFPRQPWISYYAASEINAFLRATKNSTAVEFGSGSSTAWLAVRATKLISLEHDASWHDFISKNMPPHVISVLAQREDSYTEPEILSDEQDLDFILLDGPWRLKCFEKNISRLKSTGWLYLDNSDADSSSGDPNELARLKSELFSFAKDNNRQVEVITDFAPATLHVTQGVLVRNEKP